MRQLDKGIEAWTQLICEIIQPDAITMNEASGKMCVKQHVLLFFGFIILHCHALNCRSDGGPKEADLKTMYRNCLKKQEGKNSSSGRSYSDDDWRDQKGHSQRSPWDREGRIGRDDRMNRDDRMGRDDSYRDDRNQDSIYRDDRNSGGYDTMGSGYGRSSNSDRSNGYDRMGNRDGMSRDDRMGSRIDMMGSRNDGYGRSQISGRDDFPINEEFGDDMSYNSYRSTTQQTMRRFRREKRVGTNSGQRSQYNPNSSNRRSGNDDSSRNDENNSNSNSSKNNERHQSCAMHCFLENLEMTGDNGMPDRYLVTHAITKDVKNEDLRDFLQESIEECFQILDNENTEDKCEFSKNLLMCLSEKGRANCDDWKDDIQF